MQVGPESPVRAAPRPSPVKIREVALHLAQHLADLGLSALTESSGGGGVDLGMTQEVIEYQEMVYRQHPPAAALICHEHAERDRQLRGQERHLHRLAPLVDDRRLLAFHQEGREHAGDTKVCLLYTSDAADEEDSVD